MANITFSEASGLADSIFGRSQAPIRMFLEKRAEAFEQQSIVKEIFSMGTSTHWGEKFTTMTAMEGFKPVGENGAYPWDGMQEGFGKTIEHVTWKDRFSISREMVDDAKLMDLRKQPQGFITGYYRTREQFGAALLVGSVNGEASVEFRGKKFDAKGADGKGLFAADHPSKLDNRLTQTNKFSDAFSNEALMAMETAMQNFRGDSGEILDVAPNTIVIPNDYKLKMDVFAAIGADKDPETSNNGFNYNFGRWNVIVWPYLDGILQNGSKPWLLLDTRYNEDYGGAVWLDRQKLEIKSFVDNNTDANVWNGYARFGVGFNDWRFIAVGGVEGGTQLLA